MRLKDIYNKERFVSALADDVRMVFRIAEEAAQDLVSDEDSIAFETDAETLAQALLPVAARIFELNIID